MEWDKMELKVIKQIKMIFDQELMDQLIFGMEISNNKRN